VVKDFHLHVPVAKYRFGSSNGPVPASLSRRSDALWWSPTWSPTRRRNNLPTRGSSPNCCSPNATTGLTAPLRPPGQGKPGSPATSGSPTSISTPTRTSTQPPSTLAGCGWIRIGQPLCLISDSGTGKSHLLIGLGTAAAEAGFRVKYTLATKLVNELVEAAHDKNPGQDHRPLRAS